MAEECQGFVFIFKGYILVAARLEKKAENSCKSGFTRGRMIRSSICKMRKDRCLVGVSSGNLATNFEDAIQLEFVGWANQESEEELVHVRHDQGIHFDGLVVNVSD